MTDPCERAQAQLPKLANGELGPVRRRLVERHLRGCDRCAAEQARQEAVTAELQGLGRAASADHRDAEPPPDLLAKLLEDAAEPGLRGRAAVPARGAISGARPGLTAALVMTMLVLAAAAAWAGWHLGRNRRS